MDPRYDVSFLCGPCEHDFRVASVKEELIKRKFRVGDCSIGEARVTLVIVTREWFFWNGEWCVQYAKYLCDTMKLLMERKERVIPVLYDLTPSSLIPTLYEPGRSYSVWPSPSFQRKYDTANIFEDLSSIFASITAPDLGRYDGDVDKVKLEAVLAVSDIVRTDLLEETKEYRSQMQIFNKRVSASDEMARQSAMFAINWLKLVAGELVKHAVDNVCPPPPQHHIGQPSTRFRNRVHHKKVQNVAKRLSITPPEFAGKADLCIDGRNEVSHFLVDKDWRKHCAEAVHFISQNPEVKKDVPIQCHIIMAYKEICDEFGLKRKR